jgi:gephyrin
MFFTVTRRHRQSPYPMLSVEEGNALIDKYTQPLEIEIKEVDDKLIGYVIAEKVTAREPVPGYRASIVDGYAVKGTKGHLVKSSAVCKHVRFCTN